jgi:N-acetylglutamate synthase-like GNAT family acetyltransferase
MNIRLTRAEDVPALKIVLDETRLFPSEMLSDMVSGFLCDEETQDLWLTCEVGGEAVGFCYAAPERLTDGTWNMLAIAVRPSKQGSGRGGAIVRQLENLLRERGHRVLIADTSGKEEFARTRAFYRNAATRRRPVFATFGRKATIRSFSGSGSPNRVRMQCGHFGRTASVRGRFQTAILCDFGGTKREHRV